MAVKKDSCAKHPCQNAFCQKLKHLRKEILHMEQKEFASFVGVSQSTISLYERGIITPNLEALINISDKCKISIDWLCGIQINDNAKTMGDIAKALFQLYDVKEFRCQTEYNCQMDINTELSGNNSAKEWLRITWTSSDREFVPELSCSKDIIRLVKSIAELQKQLENYGCSQTEYDRQKELLIQQYQSIAVSNMDHSNVSEIEREALCRERLKK